MLGTFYTQAGSLLTYPVMTYSHVVVDPQLSPAGQADFPILEDSTHFADFRDRRILCNWRIFLDLVDFLQETPVGYLQPCLHHCSALAELAGVIR